VRIDQDFARQIPSGRQRIFVSTQGTLDGFEMGLPDPSVGSVELFDLPVTNPIVEDVVQPHGITSWLTDYARTHTRIELRPMSRPPTGSGRLRSIEVGGASHQAAVFSGSHRPMSSSILRRHALAGAGAALLPLSALRAEALVPTPAQTEGPFYPTGFPADMDNDLVQVRGASARATGQVLHLQGRVLGVDGRVRSGALVEIWQCDAHDIYDHPRQPGRDRRDAAFQGYGRMMADAEGRYGFRTLKPVAYPGRTPHIHLKVATGDGRLLTSQFYVAGEPQNERDGVFRAAVRQPGQRERIEMKLEPANGVEAGALATAMDIVIA